MRNILTLRPLARTGLFHLRSVRARSACALAVFAWSVCVLSQLSAPGRAEGLSPEAAIGTCLYKVQQAGESAEACIGLIADPCIQAGGDPSTAGTVACIERERAIWDARLNDAYDTLQSRLPPNTSAALRDMQRAWIEARQLGCGFFDIYFEGTMARPMIANCINQETARRAIFLDRFVRDGVDSGLQRR